jgi:dienelactone hydrolase
MQTIDDDIRSMAAAPDLTMLFPGGDQAACQAWQRRFASKLRELLGDIDPPRQWWETEESGVSLPDHDRRTLRLESRGVRSLPLHVLVPKGGGAKLPAVLALHGHGPHGFDSVAGVVPSEIDNYGVELARRGYVVAAPCFTPFGRRLGDPKAYRGEDPCGVTFVRMQLFGRVLMGENLRDALWALELLTKHPRVDSSRIGCVGLSYGGRMAMLASALAPTIKVAVLSGALNVMQERVRARYSCGAQVVPGLLRFGDVPEIASLIAPRPCLWEVGQRDALMVKDWIEPSLARMRRAWGAFGKPENLRVDSFDGGHRWNGVEAYPLLERALKA